MTCAELAECEKKKLDRMIKLLEILVALIGGEDAIPAIPDSSC